MFDITGDSPEAVAYRLLLDIADCERKVFGKSEGKETADPKWILDTYAECLEATCHRREISG